MCTAIARRDGDFYFGRSLDLDASFGERVVIVQRDFCFRFRMEPPMTHHYAMMGMATVEDGYPLYAEASNECGLCAAGLNFPGNAHYFETAEEGNINLAPYELIPYLLGSCSDLAEAKALLQDLNLVNRPFRKDIPLTSLHWLIADAGGAIVLESTAGGVRIYDDPAGVLTNNPPFGFHLQNLSHYGNLSAKPAKSSFLKESGAERFGLGLGGYGLPGDYSSTSRFVRAAWLLKHAAEAAEESERVARYFHLLSAVSPVKGSVLTETGKYHYTLYSVCVNATRGILYFHTAQNPEICAVELARYGAEGGELVEIALPERAKFRFL
ncbi:MAG: choloylglycine hydrolase [Clostridia bacterium]|nr:choloylglycine hydrolase [Clostridia bacterium]